MKVHRYQFPKRLVLYLILLCSYLNSHASSSDTLASLRSHLTPGGIFDTIVDRFGHRYTLDQVAINDTLRTFNPFNPTIQPLVKSACSSGYFQLWMEQGCGMDSFSTIPAHANRLNVICQVLNDISNFVHSPLSSSSQKINIFVRSPSAAGLPSNALGEASSYYILPYKSLSSSIADNAMWITIHSGTDAYTNVISPLVTTSSFFHGMMAFNFSGSTNWHTNLTTPPASNEADLYTICLHEMLHALGFASLIDSNGLSLLDPPFNYYTRYDQFLQTSSGTSLIANSGSCNLYNFSFAAPTASLHPNPSTCNADHTVCSTAVKFVDASISQPVYTSNCWEYGSSLSHLEDECKVPGSFYLSPPSSNNKYFLMSNAIDLGVMKRYPKGEERQVLCDIGYQCDPGFGNVANLNDTSYGGSTCTGIDVAGITDGITTGGSYTYFTSLGTKDTINGTVTRGTTTTTYDILANDHLADSFSCLEVVVGSGTLNITSGTSASLVTYTPSSTATPGIHLLRYIPYNKTTSQSGNITYIYVYVSSGNCTPTVCNLINNGNFESASNCGGMFDMLFQHTPFPSVDCWSEICGTPDLYTYGCTTGFRDCNIPTTITTPATGIHPLSTSTNNHFIGLGASLFGSGSSPYYSGECLQTTLNTGIQPGATYAVRYWVKTGWGPASHIQFCGSQNMLAPVGGPYNIFYPYNPSIIPLVSRKLPADSTHWFAFTDTFTYTGSTVLNNFIVANASYLNPYTYSYGCYIFLDDITLLPVTATSLFTAPDSMMVCDTLYDLAHYVTVPGGTFTGTGVVVAGTSVNFYPTLAGAGPASILYEYTDGAGCSQQVTHTINVKCCNHFSLSIAATPNPTCGPQSVTLTGSASDNYSWTASSAKVLTGCTSCSTSVKADTPAATTIYTVTTQKYGCSYSLSDTVVVRPLPTFAVSLSGTSSICTGDSVTISATADTSFSYQWLKNGSALTGATNSSLVVTTAGTYTVTVTKKTTGCSKTSANTVITVNARPAAVITPAGSTTFCSGGNVVLNATTGSGLTYQWYRGATLISGATSSSYTANLAGSYTVLVTNSSSCSTTSSATVVTVNPLPPATITAGGPVSFCTGGSVVLNANTGARLTYQWYSGSTAVSGATSSSFATNTTGNYKVAVTDSNGCSATSAVTAVNVYTVPTATISQGTTVNMCAGTLTLNAPTGTGLTYAWYKGGTLTGVTSATYTETGLSAGTYHYYVIVTNSGVCNATSATTTVNVTARIPVTLTSNLDTIYQGQSVILTAHGISGSYTWIANSNLKTTRDSLAFALNTATYTYGVTTSGTCADTGRATVYVQTTGCSASIIFNKGGGYTNISGTVITGLAPGNYHMTGNLTIGGNALFNNAIIYVEPGYSITVASGYHLTLRNSHLFTCPNATQTWQGIVVTGSGQVTLDSNSLIEDALIGISTSGNSFSASVTNSIFNRNATGIQVSTVSSPSSQLSVTNSIFTSRKFLPYNDGLRYSYPASWPKVSSLKSRDPYVYALDPDFHIDSVGAIANINTSYDILHCNGGYQQIGIKVVNSGSTNAPGVYPATYGEVVIGDASSSTNRNLFDALQYGIYAFYASISSINNAFIHMYYYGSAGGSGIYGIVDANVTSLPFNNALTVCHRLQATSSSFTNTNLFYDCVNGIEANNYYEIISNYAIMFSHHSTASVGSTLTSPGSYGYKITNWNYRKVELQHDSITNVTNGIAFATLFGAGYPRAEGQMNIEHNTIQPYASSFSSSTWYVSRAITVNNALNCLPRSTGVPICQDKAIDSTFVFINDNRINNVNSGIEVYNFKKQPAATSHNAISLTSVGNSLFGIHHASCWKDTVISNSINGTGGFNNTVRGIYSSGNINFFISCNNPVSYNGRAFEFDGAAQTGRWLTNVMSNNYTGLYLNNTAIGQQGTSAKPIGANWSFNTNDTYIGGNVSATSSPLYVGYPPLFPSVNSALFSANRYSTTSTPPGLIQTTNPPSSGCEPSGPHPIQRLDISPFEALASNEVFSLAPDQWMGQYETYRRLMLDSALIDSSAILMDFVVQAAGSRYAWLNGIESALASGDLTTANSLLSSPASSMCQTSPDSLGVIILDCDAVNDIVSNYFYFYTAAYNLLNGSVSGTDLSNVSTIAFSCPNTAGMVVYQARALYGILFNDFPNWDDSYCSPTIEGKMPGYPSEPMASNNGQSYSLSPNPSNGNIVIRQRISDEGLVSATVLNAEGKSVYNGKFTFKGKAYRLNLGGIIPGLYLLHIRDNAGKSYMLKFVVN